MPSTIELLIIAIVVLAVFGASWLPKLARRSGVMYGETADARKQLDGARQSLGQLDRRISKVTRPLRRR